MLAERSSNGASSSSATARQSQKDVKRAQTLVMRAMRGAGRYNLEASQLFQCAEYWCIRAQRGMVGQWREYAVKKQRNTQTTRCVLSLQAWRSDHAMKRQATRRLALSCVWHMARLSLWKIYCWRRHTQFAAAQLHSKGSAVAFFRQGAERAGWKQWRGVCAVRRARSEVTGLILLCWSKQHVRVVNKWRHFATVRVELVAAVARARAAWASRHLVSAWRLWRDQDLAWWWNKLRRAARRRAKSVEDWRMSGMWHRHRWLEEALHSWQRIGEATRVQPIAIPLSPWSPLTSKEGYPELLQARPSEDESFRQYVAQQLDSNNLCPCRHVGLGGRYDIERCTNRIHRAVEDLLVLDAEGSRSSTGLSPDTHLFLLFDQCSAIQLAQVCARGYRVEASELWQLLRETYLPNREAKAWTRSKAWLAGASTRIGVECCLGEGLTCGEALDVLHASEIQLHEAEAALRRRCQDQNENQRLSLCRFISQTRRAQAALWQYLAQRSWGPFPGSMCDIFAQHHSIRSDESAMDR